jgi:hypothetical protein
MFPPFPKNQALDIKSVINFNCRLSSSGKMIAKMKGYPRMLLKTKDRKCGVGEEARMCMKNKQLIGASPEC